MSRRLFLCVVLMCCAVFVCFSQTAALRDYVGMISQGFHPDIISFMEKLQSDLERRGYNALARDLGFFLQGDSGTGFVYVGRDGRSYIITNYHVISQAYTLSITFENLNGEKTKYSDLTIVAADEDMDIALLSFAGGQNPFRQGLSFLNRPVQEGEDVYTAGFPMTVNTLIWQLGRGIISNASVRLPQEDENDTMIGPYIQHTAQVDAGNSGGPLLVQTAGVPAGYAVAGINTLSIRSRQAANYSIPLNRIQSFLDASMRPAAADQKPVLEARVNDFIEGLSASRAVYPHIAPYLSNICTGENAEAAIYEVMDKAPRSVRDNIFDRSIISSMTYAVAWTIENELRSRSGRISIEVDTIERGENGTFNVSFKVDGKTVNSVWINEYGNWRIRSFGDFASGDKTVVERRARERANRDNLRLDSSIQISAGLVYPFDMGPAFGIDLGLRLFGGNAGFGVSGFFGKDEKTGEDYKQFMFSINLFLPITVGGTVAFTPYVKGGLGTITMPNKDRYSSTPSFSMGVSVQAGLQFTTAAVPGLYLQAAYQHNFHKREAFMSFSGGDGSPLHPDMIFVSIGYSF